MPVRGEYNPMTIWTPTTYSQDMNLQQQLASGTADSSLCGDLEGVHHPISCTGDLYFDDDNTMRCDHSKAPATNPRNQAILDSTIAILLFQELEKRDKE